MSTISHDQLLSQLQDEVNFILEHTGRLFEAVARGDSPPLAEAAKLKHILPPSTRRFHEALDQFEDELQLAKLVMRRDLAMCRTDGSVSHPFQLSNASASADGSNSAVSEPVRDGNSVAEKITSSEPDSFAQGDDMRHAVRDENTFEMQNRSAEDAALSANYPDASAEQPTNTDLPDIQSHTDMKISDAISEVNTVQPPLASSLEVSTDLNNEVAPDTAVSKNTNDLESLFDGPASAEAGDAPQFDLDSNANADFDFSFDPNVDNDHMDNDNISALLPGLQEYTNTQPIGDGDHEFEGFFAEDTGGHGNGSQFETGHRDSTFDDLLDLAEFNAGDVDAQAEGDENHDFDFSFD